MGGRSEEELRRPEADPPAGPALPPGGARRGELAAVGLLLAWCGVLYLWGLGQVPLTGWDEPKYAAISREIARSGRWLPLRFNRSPYLNKPPLWFWCTALCMRALGPNERAARAVSACSATALSLATFALLRPLGRTAALGAALCLSSFPLMIRNGRKACVDPLLSLLVFGSIAALWWGYRREGRWWTRGGYALMGLAVCTKGPIGAIVPGLTFLTLLALRGELAAWRRLRPLEGAALVLAVAVPYYALVEAHAGGFLRCFLWGQNVHRYLWGDYGHNLHPPWYFLPVILWGTFPFWLHFGPQLVHALRRPREVPGEVLLCAAWFAGSFAFLSLCRSKLDRYLLPLLPPAAGLAGWSLARGALRDRAVLWLQLLALGAGMAVAWGGLLPAQQTLGIEDRLGRVPLLYALMLLPGLVLLGAGMWRNARGARLAGLFALAAANGACLAHLGLPLEGARKSAALAELARLAAGRPEPLVVTYGFQRAVVAFYCEKPVLAVKPWKPSGPPRERRAREEVARGRALLIAQRKYLSRLRGWPLRRLAERGEFLLLGPAPPGRSPPDRDRAAAGPAT